MKKLNGSNLAFDCKTDSNKQPQCINTRQHLENSRLSQVIFSGSVPAPILRLPFAPNCSMNLSMKQPIPIRSTKMSVVTLGFTKEEVCDLDLSILEEMMRKKRLNMSEVHFIKLERERLKRQKRKKRHKQKQKAEYLNLENEVDYLLQVKDKLQRERLCLIEEIRFFITQEGICELEIPLMT